MAGRTGIAKKGKLYGDWGMSDMEQGIDEAQASSAPAKPKYRGYKSDLAFIAAEKAKKLAAEKKKKKKQLKKRDKDFMTREVKSGPRNEEVESRTPYKVIKGEDYVASKKKKKKKRIGRTMY